MTRALVLGGGGSVGVAWETGIAAGLLDGGVDLRTAGLIVGTSAGSVVGANLGHGRDARGLLDQLRSRSSDEIPDVVPRDPSEIMKVFQLWASFDEMTPAASAQVGALALAAATVPQEQWLAGFTRNAWPGWPERPLLVCAVDCESGRLRVLRRDDGVPIERAVAASCAVPGLFPPVTIDGRHYTDGGVRSWTSADLALEARPERVLVIAPAGHDGPGVRGLAARQLAREAEQLRVAGVDVRTVIFDDAMRALGEHLMDPALVGQSSELGVAHGRRIAPELLGWW